MSRIPNLYRAMTAVALVLASLLSAVFVVLAPGGDGSRLEGIAAGGPAATASALAFLWSQMPLAVGMVGVAHLLRPRTPVLATASVALVVTSAFGHTVFGGISLVELSMVADPEGVFRYASLHEESLAAAGIFSVLGVLGLALGTILLAVALLRARLGLGWVGVVLLGFVVVELAGGSQPWSARAAAALCVIGFGGLAVAVARSERRAWMTAHDADSEAGADSRTRVAVSG